MTGEGEGKEGTFFFCFCSNFRAITRLKTLATQAMCKRTQHVTANNVLPRAKHFQLQHGQNPWGKLRGEIGVDIPNGKVLEAI